MLICYLEVVWLIYRLTEGAPWVPNHNFLVGGSCKVGGIVGILRAQWCHVSNQQVDMLCHNVTVGDLAVHIQVGGKVQYSNTVEKDVA